MTRDEVMAMTDGELRIKAAELRGWTQISTLAMTGLPPPTSPKGRYTAALPWYPNDIAAAWELIAVWKPRGFMLYTDDKTHGKWLAHFTRETRPTLNDSRLKNPMVVGAETAPRAITRAFILAMAQEAR